MPAANDSGRSSKITRKKAARVINSQRMNIVKRSAARTAPIIAPMKNIKRA